MSLSCGCDKTNCVQVDLSIAHFNAVILLVIRVAYHRHYNPGRVRGEGGEEGNEKGGRRQEKSGGRGGVRGEGMKEAGGEVREGRSEGRKEEGGRRRVEGGER